MKHLLLTLTLLGAGAVAQAQTASPTVTTTTTASKVYPSGYTFKQMLDALGALKGVSLRGVGFDERGYLNLTVADEAARQQAIEQVAAAGLPTGVLAFGSVPLIPTETPSTENTSAENTAATVTETPQVTPPTSLPAAADTLAQPHRAELTGPSSIQAGQATTWSFMLTNTGSAPLNLAHGACDVRFEVLNAAGEVVRPDPTNTLCTMQMVYTNLQAGESGEVQKIRWDGKDGAGQPVPAGEYTIRAAFRGAGAVVPAQEFRVTVQ